MHACVYMPRRSRVCARARASATPDETPLQKTVVRGFENGGWGGEGNRKQGYKKKERRREGEGEERRAEEERGEAFLYSTAVHSSRDGEPDGVATLVIHGVELAQKDVANDPQRRPRDVDPGKGAQALVLDLEDVVLGREGVRLAAKVERQVGQGLDRRALDRVCTQQGDGGKDQSFLRLARGNRDTEDDGR